MVKGRPPGAALDVGMGQGRNAIYLAQQGWNVTGFDPADKAVALANQTANRLGVKLTTVVQGSEAFDFGENRWDLVLLSYVSVRDVAAKVVRALKPGGIVVVEGFHRDVTRSRPVGGGVVFDSNELPRLFSSLRVLRYEDVEAKTDFGTEHRASGEVVRDEGVRDAHFFASAPAAACWKARRTSLASLLGKFERCTIRM